MTDTHTTAHIPDEAVKAAKKAVSERCKKTYLTNDQMYAALSAALPHLSAPCATKPVDVAAAREQCAKVAECAFDDRPRDRVGHPSQMDWEDGFRDGTRASAAAIRAALAQGGGE